MLNPETSPELNKRDTDLSVEKITSSVGPDHISLDHFKKLKNYTEEEVEKDKKKLKSTEAKFKKKDAELSPDERKELEMSRKRGEAMEIVLADLLDRWFETDDIEVITQRTTRFDDVVNGIDIIIEFKTPESIEKSALAIDASLNVAGIKEKLKRCYKKVTDENKEFQVKYFQGQFVDESGEYPHGRLQSVIPMAAGLGYKNANDLFEEFAEYLSARDRSPDEGREKMKKLENNSIKKIFLKQIQNQLDFYKRNHEKINDDLVAEIEKISSIIDRVSEEMNSVVCDFRQKDDWVLKEIEKFSQNK